VNALAELDPDRLRLIAGAVVAILLLVVVTMPRRRSRSPHSDRP